MNLQYCNIRPLARVYISSDKPTALTLLKSFGIAVHSILYFVYTFLYVCSICIFVFMFLSGKAVLVKVIQACNLLDKEPKVSVDVEDIVRVSNLMPSQKT